MHKKLESELISLAHSILKMKNKDDVFALKEKSREIYEKLSMLAFVDEYLATTPNSAEAKEELVEKIETAFEQKEESIIDLKEEKAEKILEEKVVFNLIDEPEEEVKKEETPKAVEEKKEPEVKTQKIEQPFDELEEIMFAKPEQIEEPELIKEVVKVEERKTMSLEEELHDIISVDVMADLFENVQPKSLNDKLNTNIQIGLNDRIAFVKHLFNNQQEDYNRVVSQLNTFKTEKEAKSFINKMVKPDYNWAEQEELEIRFLEIVARKFA